MKKAMSTSLLRSNVFCLLAAAAAALGTAWPGEEAKPWPLTSDRPVETLDHRTIEDLIASAGTERFRFAVFGDQRALADGEWQSMIEQIARLDRTPGEPFFLVDTGDVIFNGTWSDQFHMLREILMPAADLPYLVAVGNHEKNNNEERKARENTARFFSYLDRSFSPDRMYYRKEIGPALFLFLDTNDLLYGDDGDRTTAEGVPPGSRAEAQLDWLMGEFEADDRGEEALTIVVMHHPFLQTSSKHASQARSLWGLRFQGRSLPDILLDGGTDLILSGHTHTYERFRFRREDGKEAEMINFSGRPRASFLWFGRSIRKARDIRGREMKWFKGREWEWLDRITIIQEECMTGGGKNQFGIFTVGESGDITMRLHFLEKRGESRAVPSGRVKIR